MSNRKMDEYKIDGHKLHYHVDRLNDWMNHKMIYPVYIEISPSGNCNHRCTFCALDYMEYKKKNLDSERLKTRMTELGQLGVKSIMYAGEGEPLLNTDMADIITHTRQSGMDVAITTNGVFLDKALSTKILGSVEWIKVSINAGTAETYAKIHRCRATDFDKVIKNISDAVRIKQHHGHRCALGMQMVLIPDNQKDVKTLAEIAKDTGVDYLVIKPYSQHLMSKTTKYNIIRYDQYKFLEKELTAYNTDTFKVVFRLNSMKKWDMGERDYDHCLALPFWAYIDAGGNVWGCSAYLGDDNFCYGNIYNQSFKEIWEGDKRKNAPGVFKRFDANECRVNCRMDEINRYLWSLKNPPAHVNFI